MLTHKYTFGQLCILAASLGWGEVQGQTLIGLGYPPGQTVSEAYGISADGSVVVGTAGFAFRWTHDTGMVDIGVLPNGFGTVAAGVSGDGNTVVGQCGITVAGGGTRYRAIAWTPTTGMTNLGAVTTHSHSYARCASANGSVIAGQSQMLSSREQAVRWTNGQGMTFLGAMPGGTRSYVSAISANGTTIVGNGDSSSGYRGFRWRAGEGMIILGVLGGGTYSSAQSVNGNGSIIAGQSDATGDIGCAVWWSESGAVTSLGKFPGGTWSYAELISSDGTLIAGQADLMGVATPCVWVAGSIVKATTYLETIGIDLTGWDSLEIESLSSDGQYLTGTGWHNGQREAWLANTGTDSDGDGLWDKWETQGIPYLLNDGTVGHYLLPGANQFRKDIYVEADAMIGRSPSASALNRVAAAFAAAPLPPPVNAPPNTPGGIRLHVVGLADPGLDEASLTLVDYYDAVNPTIGAFQFFQYDKQNLSGHGGFGTVAERSDVANWPAIKKAKAKAFRYCIFGNRCSADWSGGVAEAFLCNDFMVTLGQLHQLNYSADILDDYYAATFMHELGHTLGLRHGGDQGAYEDSQDRRWNYKPNYFSVMNYSWAFPSTQLPPGNGPGLRYKDFFPNYSGLPLPGLDENALREDLGIGGSDPRVRVPYRIAVGETNCQTHGICSIPPVSPPGNQCIRYARLKGKVDWNNDCISATGGTVQRDVNSLGESTVTSFDVLSGYNDWANLRFDFLDSPAYADEVNVVNAPTEMPHNEIMSLMAFPQLPPGTGDGNCDGLVDARDIEPFIKALTNPPLYHAAFPLCNILEYDFSDNGTIDSGDLSTFVYALLITD